ncbi:MAG TPA: four helix bundle protein [Ignavibacteria bacterium]|nr:four helix bundle protein [Ignavibacteria bacterium]
MKESIIQEKSYKFALRIVKLYMFLKNDKKEYELSKQILRSGTSIGANIEEAQGGQSKKDFLYKISVAYKETRETHYWLRLLKDSELIDEKLFESFIKDCNELLKIIGKIQITLKKETEIRNS